MNSNARINTKRARMTNDKKKNKKNNQIQRNCPQLFKTACSACW